MNFDIWIFIKTNQAMPSEQDTKENTVKPRPPIVVILGHVDHGKTTILDRIRQTKVAEKETGGITQHIGAYQVTLPPAEAKLSRGQEDEGSRVETDEILSRQKAAQDNLAAGGRKITFLDTPGHEAFSAMRSRGTRVADLAVLVVAADEGVKPQTKEAIEQILRLNLPFVVAINKMDKPSALPEKIKKELADNNVLVESLGGKIPSVLVSAKTGLGINELLEIILLVAEMEEIKSNYAAPASGVIIESYLDPRRGPTATLLVQQGILRQENVIAAESAYGQIKSLEDFLGQPVSVAQPATPVSMTGFNQVPPVGEEWQAMPSFQTARDKVTVKKEQEKRKREPAEIFTIKPEQKVFNLILKADVSGSLEAVREALKSVPQEEIVLRMIKAEVGNIAESDLQLAQAAKAKIYGFRTGCPGPVGDWAKKSNIKVTLSPIIYELIQAVRQDAANLLALEIIRQNLGRVKIIALFKTEGRRQIIGGRVTTGKIEKGGPAEVIRDEETLGSGKILQLQMNKENVGEITKDKEGGILFESEVKIEKGDILEVYKEERKKREL